MGIRITGRIRSLAQVVFDHARVDAPRLYQIEPLPEENISGPWAAKDIAALLYRAKKLRLRATINHKEEINPYPEEPPYLQSVTTSIDIELVRMRDAGFDVPVENEIELLQNYTYNYYQDQDGNGVTFASRPYLDDGQWYLAASVYALSEEKTTAPSKVLIAQESSSGYPISANFEILGTNYEIPAKVILLETGGDPEIVVEDASCSIEVTEWWTYATKSGAPAWNATTGAPANGGPGA
jgi:hypothetical protein